MNEFEQMCESHRRQPVTPRRAQDEDPEVTRQYERMAKDPKYASTVEARVHGKAAAREVGKGNNRKAAALATTAAHHARNVLGRDKDLVEWAKEEEHEKEHEGHDELAVHEYRERYGHERGVDEDGEDSSPMERVQRKNANKSKVSQRVDAETRSTVAEGTRKMGFHGKAGRLGLKKEEKETKGWTQDGVVNAFKAGHGVGENLAEGRVADSSPLARAIRKAKDSTQEERQVKKEESGFSPFAKVKDPGKRKEIAGKLKTLRETSRQTPGYKPRGQ